METTLGGKRLGSGKQMKIELSNYERSTVNLDRKFTSSIAPGVLYPAYVNIGLRGDTFEFDIQSILRTLPTQGPLFGTFKLQIDLFAAPVRLYHGLLHNNPINLGMKMNQVKFPKLIVQSYKKNRKTNQFENIETLEDLKEYGEFANNSLLKYLGISGIGSNGKVTDELIRYFNALPVLAYYDIFKNYYANKQEESAYVITREFNYLGGSATDIPIAVQGGKTLETKPSNLVDIFGGQESAGGFQLEGVGQTYGEIILSRVYQGQADEAITFAELILSATNINEENIKFSLNGFTGYSSTQSIKQLQELGILKVIKGNSQIRISPIGEDTLRIRQIIGDYTLGEDKIKLQPFLLKGLDEMRNQLLSFHTLGSSYIINTRSIYPYSLLSSFGETGKSMNCYPMAGLVVKTYQSDIFNCWLNKEQIDGNNGINEITKVSTASGGFTIDSLILAKKVYDMLNRIQMAGGTYQDWQDAVYTDKAAIIAETPIYYGGYSGNIVFEEVVQSSATEMNGEKQPLGTLGGRGTIYGGQDGKVIMKLDEASVIMAIVSITPRISYTQGNKWYMTELDNMDDLHKPALDQIGFQNLMQEQAAWWTGNTEANKKERKVIGKQPAWMNWRTDYDEAYGDFAQNAERAYMILQRNYQMTGSIEDTRIGDMTTYIDPSKYNYAFAYNELDAQNFWLQVQFDVKARRLITAREIPNL